MEARKRSRQFDLTHAGSKGYEAWVVGPNEVAGARAEAVCCKHQSLLVKQKGLHKENVVASEKDVAEGDRNPAAGRF